MTREKHPLIKKGDLWLDPDTRNPFTGTSITMLDGTNVVSDWIPVENRRVNGVWETFYPDSSPKTCVAFLNEVLHDDFERFFENDRLRWNGSYTNGERCGTWTVEGETETHPTCR